MELRMSNEMADGRSSTAELHQAIASHSSSLAAVHQNSESTKLQMEGLGKAVDMLRKRCEGETLRLETAQRAAAAKIQESCESLLEQRRQMKRLEELVSSEKEVPVCRLCTKDSPASQLGAKPCSLHFSQHHEHQARIAPPSHDFPSVLLKGLEDRVKALEAIIEKEQQELHNWTEYTKMKLEQQVAAVTELSQVRQANGERQGCTLPISQHATIEEVRDMVQQAGRDILEATDTSVAPIREGLDNLKSAQSEQIKFLERLDDSQKLAANVRGGIVSLGQNFKELKIHVDKGLEVGQFDCFHLQLFWPRQAACRNTASHVSIIWSRL
eukprot:evm.model.scf_26.24 EVM.evm.TU.scf_26.24   scf_26:200934-204908(-)